MSIAQNIAYIQEKIRDVAMRSGRNESSIRLMAVSKFHSAKEITAAYDAGIRLFGENRVQEADEKFSDISLLGAELHMIGSLQRNKVRRILPLVDCIQSINRIELLEEIAKQLSQIPSKKKVKLLFEIHTGEESKTGFLSDLDLEEAIEYAIHTGLCPAGFMTMAPFTDDKTLIRESFVTLRKTAERMQKKFSQVRLAELSMGMSNDFEIAIEEGSTLVRVGTAIFGTPSYGVNK